MTDSKELDWNEGTELARCEKVIKEGRDTFIAVGEALMTIRDKRLYRATHKDFPAYVKDKCGFGKSRAYQLIAAAREDGESSSTNGGKKAVNERQSRAKREPAASKPTRKTVVTASDTDGQPTGPGAEFPDSQGEHSKSGAGDNGSESASTRDIDSENADEHEETSPASDPPGVEPFHGPERSDEPEPDSMSAAQARVARAVRCLKSARESVRSEFQIKGQDIGHPWLAHYGFDLLIGTLNQLIREVEDLLPVGGKAGNPETARSAKAKEAAKK